MSTEKAFEAEQHCRIMTAGVPNIINSRISGFFQSTFGISDLFLRKACAISGYLLSVNPFNQFSRVWKAIKRICLLSALASLGMNREKSQLDARLKVNKKSNMPVVSTFCGKYRNSALLGRKFTT